MAAISLSKQSLVLILFSIFLLAFGLRYGESIQENGLSFGDGGRDLLVTKWVAEGKTDFNISPLSSLTFVPNSFLYFQTLGLVYRFGGMWASSLIPVFGGALVTIFTFFIVRKIFNSQWLGLWSSFLIAISSFFIRSSSLVWQPNIQFPFVIATFLMVIMAMYTHQKKYYWWSLLPMFFSLSLHHSGILNMGIFSFFLVGDYWFFVLKKRLQKKEVNYLIAILILWLLWFAITYFGRDIVFDVTSSGEFGLISWQALRDQVMSFVNGLFFAFGGHLFFSTWQKLFIIVLPILALFRSVQKKVIPKRISFFIATCLLSLVFLILVPGEEYRHWYFYFQTYLFFILIPLLPRIIWPKVNVGKYLLVVSILIFSWLMIKVFYNSDQYISEPLNESRVSAMVVDNYLKKNNQSMTEFTMVTKDFGSEENILQNLTYSYRPASVQFQLELINSEYSKRIEVMDATKIWSNYSEKDSNQYFLFCFDYNDLFADCVKSIYSQEGDELEFELLTSFDFYRSVHIFVIKKVASESFGN